MPAGGVSTRQWDEQVLRDMGVPQSAWGNDLRFLQSWQTRETGGGWPDRALYNLLGNMGHSGGRYGGTPVNNYLGGGGGLLAYPSWQQGAADTANRISQYGDLSAAFQAGNINPNASYAGLRRWSGGGYGSLSGTNPVTGSQALSQIGNQPQIDQNNINNLFSQGQIADIQQLASSDAAFANKEAGFQQQLLGLSNQQLWYQAAALKRQEQLDPKLYGLQQQQFGLEEKGLASQRSDITRHGMANIASTQSQEAGAGNLFTRGGVAQLQNVKGDLVSQLMGNQRSLSGLKLTEQGSALRFKEQMSQLQDQQKNIDILAKRYGISAQEIRARLQNQLAQINYGSDQSILGLGAGILNNLNANAALYAGAGIPPQGGLGSTGSSGAYGNYDPSASGVDRNYRGPQ